MGCCGSPDVASLQRLPAGPSAPQAPRWGQVGSKNKDQTRRLGPEPRDAGVSGQGALMEETRGSRELRFLSLIAGPLGRPVRPWEVMELPALSAPPSGLGAVVRAAGRAPRLLPMTLDGRDSLGAKPLSTEGDLMEFPDTVPGPAALAGATQAVDVPFGEPRSPDPPERQAPCC